MRRLAAMAAVLAAAFAVFYLAARTPTPGPASATLSNRDFCAACALRDISGIAQSPHPVASAADDAARAYLLGRMQALDLHPRVQHAVSHFVLTRGSTTYLAIAPVNNLIGVIPGRDRDAPALGLMAHYDSVPGSPGAADDATGVADVLDVARAIEARGQPRRDVVVVLTDGEEAGLLGARAFFGADPQARRLGFVINLESRGGGGRANMFETGPDAGEAVRLYGRTVASPQASAIFPFVYRYLPNDTDFSVARARGVRGLNFAFIGRQFDYHSPSSTVAALDKGSVEHMGQSVLGPAAALASGAELPRAAPDLVYSDVLGRLFISYAPAMGWAVLALGAGLMLLAAWRVSRRERLSAAAAGLGLAASLAILICAGLTLLAARWMTGVGQGWMAYRPLLARFPLFEVAAALAGVSPLLLVPGALARVRSPASAWLGLLASALVFCIVAQVLAPTIAFLLAWPLVAGALGAALTTGGTARAPIAWTAYGLVAIVTIAWVVGQAHGTLQGLDAAPVCAIYVWLAALITFPLASPPAARGPVMVFGLALLLAGLGIALDLRLTDPWSARYPRAVEPILLTRSDGRAWRASLASADAWTRRFLGPGQIETLSGVPGLGPLVAVRAAAPEHPADLAMATGADGALHLRVTGPEVRPTLFLDLAPTTPLRASLDGLPLASLPAGGRVRIEWSGAGGDLVLAGVGHGTLRLSYALVTPGWPATSAPIPPMPANRMAWDMAPASVAYGTRDLTF